MMMNFRPAIATGFAICGIYLQLACHAQSITSDTGKDSLSSRAGSSSLDRAARELLASASAERPADPRAAADASTTTQSASAPNTSTTVSVTASNDEVIKELAEMKARIALLESELKANREASADRDASALRAAETADASSNPASGGQAATPPPPVAAPAPPEISAERLTKEAPFPGDWTWLNSNGHAVDSPIVLFLKYISDVWQDHYDDYKKQYGDKPKLIRRNDEKRAVRSAARRQLLCALRASLRSRQRRAHRQGPSRD